MRVSKRHFLASVLVMLTAAAVASADDAKPLAVFDASTVDGTPAARALWQPIHENSPPVEIDRRADGACLRLPCNFDTHTYWRVGWDLKGQWDLAGARRVTVTVVPDGSRGTPFTLYLHSGNGWYRGHFYVPMGESTASVAMKAFAMEENPGGWHRVDVVRISISRDVAADRSVRLRGIEAEIGRAKVALYRNDAGLAREGGIPQFTRIVADALDRLGVEYELMGDDAVADGRLADKTVALLPLNPTLDARTADALAKFVAAGGKLIVCYSLSPPLDRLLGVRLDGHVDAGDADRLSAIEFRSDPQAPPITVTQHSWTTRKIVAGDGTRRHFP